MTKKHSRRVVPAIVLALLALLAVAGLWLSGASYPAGDAARAALASDSQVTVWSEGELTVFAPDKPEQGFIFYPGGLVEHTAYAPLLHDLAQQGWLCVLTEMPFDLAVLDSHAADGVRERFPEIDRWSIGGHSLGGAMAASYAASHPGDFDALILLAAYSTADLTDSRMTVFSLYGSEDGVLNRSKYAGYRANLPATLVEAILPGGNHAQFGDYGLQQGDGTAAVSPEEQRAWAVRILTGK